MRRELETTQCTTLVLGSGIAGLTYALKAAAYGDVLILTKKASADSSTNWAQGGIASVMDPQDRLELHVDDTLKAGAGLCRPEVVELVVEHGPRLVRELMEIGVDFSKREDGTGLDLGREGGHSHRRILHAKDRTGREIERALLAAVADNPRITIREDHFTLDLWVGPSAEGGTRCFGAQYFAPDTGRVGLVRAHHTLLATGGCGKVYLYTTNPDIATADGVAMAARAGCSIVNLEFVQFHPTCLYDPHAKSFLISEAVRGEGAILRNLAGEDFMAGFESGSLSTRDIVAREIDAQMKTRGDKYVHLDPSSIGESEFRERFPEISNRLEALGIVPGRDPIPVVPAAHYMCGGVAVDLFGRTEIHGLFAAGEVSCTGVHGANRLASNSLLEALVTADRAATLEPTIYRGEEPPPPPGPGSEPPRSDQGVILDHEWDAVRRLLWDYVGLVRTQDRLERAITRVALMHEWAEDLFARTLPGRDLSELRNIALVGRMLARAALERKESRGLHYIAEFPNPAEEAAESWLRWDGTRVLAESRVWRTVGTA